MLDKKEVVMNRESVDWLEVILQLCTGTSQTLLLLVVLLNMRKP